MGRDYFIVAVSKNLHHESDNKHCISLDYEPDYDEKHEIENQLYQSKYQDCKYLEDLDTKHINDFCQLCRWYLEPACYENKYVVHDYHQVRLPSFRGNFFMDEFLYPSEVAYEYCQEGGSVYCITLSDIDDMEERVNDICLPRRNSDKQQFKQTNEALQFLKEWSCKDDIKILYFTEV